MKQTTQKSATQAFQITVSHNHEKITGQFHQKQTTNEPYREKITTLHAQFTQYGRNAREWMRKCELLLPHIEKHRVWEKKGFSCIYEYAAKLAGMSRNRVDVVLWTMRKIEGKEEILRVVEAKGVNAVRPIANMVTAENQSFWAEKASEMSMHTLEIYAKEFRNAGILQNEEDSNLNGLLESKNDANSCRAARRVVGMELELEVVNELEKLKGKEDWNTLMKELLEMRRAKLEAEKPEAVKVVGKSSKALNKNATGRVLEQVLSPGKAKRGKSYHSRPAPAKIQKFVKAKTNGQCAYPGCNKPHEILHHTERFSLTHEHDPNTIVPLCREHERLAHLGLIENESLEPMFWSVREWPDKSDVKWKVDAKVQKYRRR